ncbi:MAG TPA: Maf family nucleotide pyrophosphatase [Polyangia bacterium]|jgi:septum formation protein
MPAPLPHLVLASTSTFRRELLARLRLPFDVARPDTDERPRPGEAPAATAERLAREKAEAVAARFPGALVIGSDQVASCGDERFDKPGSRAGAIAQLERLAGRTVVFHTGVCLLNAATGACQVRGVPTEVGYRRLTRDAIERYVDADDPSGCAGAIKSESAGIALVELLRGDDPTALVGLPLIALCAMLRAEGVPLP